MSAYIRFLTWGEWLARIRSVSCAILSSPRLIFALCFVSLIGRSLAIFILAVYTISSCQGGYDFQVNIFLFQDTGFRFKWNKFGKCLNSFQTSNFSFLNFKDFQSHLPPYEVNANAYRCSFLCIQLPILTRTRVFIWLATLPPLTTMIHVLLCFTVVEHGWKFYFCI